MDQKNFVVQISPKTIVFTLFIVVIGWFLYEIRDLVPVIIAAIIFSLALIPGKKFLARFRIPAPIAVVLLYLFAFLVLSFFLYTLIPIISQQYVVFIESLPKIIEVARSFFVGTQLENLVTDLLPIYTEGNEPKALPEVLNLFQGFFSTAGKGVLSLFGSLVDVALFLLLTFLFSVKPSALDNALEVLTPAKYQRYIENLWERTKRKMGQWFQGQILLVFVIGSLTYLPLLLLDVPNALLLATFAGVMELIPIFGPVIGAIPAVLMALTTGNITTVLLVVLVFIVIQQLENNLIYPLVVSKVVGVSSILIILAVVVGAMLAGFIGVVIAVPLAGVLQEFFDDIKSGNIKRFVNEESDKSKEII